MSEHSARGMVARAAPPVLPTIVTHNYHPDYGPFGNICDGSRQDASASLAAMIARGIRCSRPTYLERRWSTEAWLSREARRKLPAIRLRRPRYFFLGDFADGLDGARPASIQIPLAALPAESLTFTYPDSMASFALATRAHHAAERRCFHGQVFTLAEIQDVVSAVGLPARNYPRPPGALSDGFIEMQLWDDAPLRAFLIEAP